MATSVDQTDFLKTALRLPRELHAWLLEFASAQGVSLNSAIVLILDGRRRELPAVRTDEFGDKALDEIEARIRRAMKDQ